MTLLSVAGSPAGMPRAALCSQKPHAWHLERLAVVYVRQSTPQQVLAHQESTRLQYGLVERAQALGWAAERILVIDDDVGRSAATADGRAGFQRLVSEVSLDHVGIILGIEEDAKAVTRQIAARGQDHHGCANEGGPLVLLQRHRPLYGSRSANNSSPPGEQARRTGSNRGRGAGPSVGAGA